jgi:hypothetical protein
MTVTLIERLIAIHNDPRLKLGWYEQDAIQEAITALKTPAAQVEPAPAQPVPDAMTYAAARSMAITKEWARGWEDCRALMLAAAAQEQTPG